jgi:hypothetical protein
MINPIKALKAYINKQKDTRDKKAIDAVCAQICQENRIKVASWITEENRTTTGSNKMLYDFAVLSQQLEKIRAFRNAYPCDSIEYKEADKKAARILWQMNEISRNIMAVMDVEDGIIDETINKALNGSDE